MSLLHLLPLTVWEHVRDAGDYRPDSYDVDGFVHCSGDDAVMLAVANAYYRAAVDELVVLELDAAKLRAEVRWEAPDPAPPPGVAAETLFPHVYGPLDLAAVVRVRRLVRDDAGDFSGYQPVV